VTSNAEIQKSQPLHLLVVDDCPVQRQLTAVYGRMLGFEVDVAAGGYEATLACSAKSYHVVLMDCDMPVVDGLEATRRIRAHDQSPVIVAFTTNDNRQRCLDAGMDYFVSKLRSERLLELLQELKNDMVAAQDPSSAVQ
jgi:CheY-like chemotaxis protein